MIISQTKCDECGKIHDSLSILDLGHGKKRLASLTLHDPYKNFDFCNEECVTEFLVKRLGLKKQSIIT